MKAGCKEYLERYLSPHADGELEISEQRAVEEHLRGCARCRAALASERALKRLVRDRLSAESAPAHVEARLRAALDEIDTQAHAPRKPASRSMTRDYRWLWVPTALAAALVIAILTTTRQRSEQSPDNPLFERAITEFAMLQANFVPNPPSDSETALALSMDMADMPVGIWNFNKSGFQLVGGGLGMLPDGQHLSFTFYRGPFDQAILDMRLRGAARTPPTGAVMQIDGHIFYNYRGVSICLTLNPAGDFTCILVTGEPIDKLVQIVSLAEVNHAKHS